MRRFDIVEMLNLACVAPVVSVIRIELFCGVAVQFPYKFYCSFGDVKWLVFDTARLCRLIGV